MRKNDIKVGEEYAVDQAHTYSYSSFGTRARVKVVEVKPDPKRKLTIVKALRLLAGPDGAGTSSWAETPSTYTARDIISPWDEYVIQRNTRRKANLEARERAAKRFADKAAERLPKVRLIRDVAFRLSLDSIAPSGGTDHVRVSLDDLHALALICQAAGLVRDWT